MIRFSPETSPTTVHIRVPLGRATRRIAVGLAALVTIAGANAAQASSPLDSTATLLWTAPGDDGMVGRATSYALRFRNVAIAGTDTASWWAAATPVTGLPAPGVPGSTDSVTVVGLDPLQPYYFMIRTADEIPNWSGFSNVAFRPIVTDVTAPSAITNLAASAPQPLGSSPNAWPADVVDTARLRNTPPIRRR